MSLRTFLKIEFKILKLKKTGNWKLVKLNEFPDFNDVQIFTMICIHFRSVNVVCEQKYVGLYLLKQGRTHTCKGCF